MPDYVPQDWVDDDGTGTTGTPVTKARMDYIEGGIRDASLRSDWGSVQGTLSTNYNLAGGGPGPTMALDGFVLDGASGGRVLLMGQTDPSRNGIYNYFYNGFSGASSLTRAADNTLPEHFWGGREVLVLNGRYAGQKIMYSGWDNLFPDSGDPLPFSAPAAVGRAFAFLMGG